MALTHCLTHTGYCCDENKAQFCSGLWTMAVSPWTAFAYWWGGWQHSSRQGNAWAWPQYTTGVKAPPSWVGCQGSSLMKNLSCTEITWNKSGQCHHTPQMQSSGARQSGWWKFPIIVQKRSPATVNFASVPGAKSYSSPICHAQLLNGGVVSRQRLSSTDKNNGVYHYTCRRFPGSS